MKQVRVEPRSSTGRCPRARDVGRRDARTILSHERNHVFKVGGGPIYWAAVLLPFSGKKIRKVYVQFGAVCYSTKKLRKMLGESIPFGGGVRSPPPHPPVVALMHSAAKPPAVVGAVDRWDRQTDGRTPGRFIDSAAHTMRAL